MPWSLDHATGLSHCDAHFGPGQQHAEQQPMGSGDRIGSGTMLQKACPVTWTLTW
jgi:hypothetical protein